MIAVSAIDFAKEQIKPVNDILNNVLDENLSRKIFREAGELGFLSVDVPEKFGGLELDKTTSSIIVDCLSSGESGFNSFCATVPLLVLSGLGYIGISSRRF